MTLALALAGGAQSLFAVIAFSGAGILFRRLDKNGYEKEIKRHNLAVEELARAKEKWYENKVKRNDDIQATSRHFAKGCLMQTLTSTQRSRLWTS